MWRKIRLLQVDMNPVNLCDPHLIDLFGAKGHGPEREQTILFFFSFLLRQQQTWEQVAPRVKS